MPSGLQDFWGAIDKDGSSSQKLLEDVLHVLDSDQDAQQPREAVTLDAPTQSQPDTSTSTRSAVPLGHAAGSLKDAGIADLAQPEVPGSIADGKSKQPCLAQPQTDGDQLRALENDAALASANCSLQGCATDHSGYPPSVAAASRLPKGEPETSTATATMTSPAADIPDEATQCLHFGGLRRCNEPALQDDLSAPGMSTLQCKLQRKGPHVSHIDACRFITGSTQACTDAAESWCG